VRADLVAAGRRIVDGLGAWRVVQTWEQAARQSRPQNRTPASPPVNSAALVARPATLQDARALWQWRNDPTTRAFSRSSAQVSWDDHLDWLTASLTRTDRVLLMIEDPGGTGEGVETVGTVRWDLAGQEGEAEGGHEWEVSITVAPQWRGQSLGGLLLRAAEQALSEVTRSRGTDVTAYLAVVHPDNLASVRLFETSAYVPDLPPDPQGFMRFRKMARVP
jgi:RimJ/RimL family protein N-acetyltransferase